MSKIEWTDRSDWNPIRGCTRVSEGCRNCYAEAIAARFSDPGQAFHGFAERTSAGPRWTGKVALIEDRLALPLKWRKPARVFVNSAFDLFHESVPDAWIDRVFAVMALAPQHQFQVLTKRSKRMREYVTARSQLGGNIAGIAVAILEECESEYSGGIKTTYPLRAAARRDAIVDSIYGGLSNVWLGVSAERQQEADERIPDLLATPAAVRFVSAEPLLSDIDFTVRPLENRAGWWNWLCGERHTSPLHAAPQKTANLNWIIVGGESGSTARPMHPDWARSIRDQCGAAGVPFFFKQWGEWSPVGRGDRGRAPAPGEFVLELSEGAGRRGAILDAKSGRWSEFDPGERHGDVFRVGKKLAGRLLDGRTHDEFPRSAA